MLAVHPAGVTDIDTIQQLAHSIWPATYQEILSPEQLSYMLDLIYSKPALTKQINELHHRFIILFSDEMPVGFASYSPKDAEDDVTWRLHKIYLLQNQQGRGTGKFLLNYIIADAKEHGATLLELNVNRYNKARGFYEHNGFIILREDKIDIGQGYFMDDYIMQLTLK